MSGMETVPFYLRVRESFRYYLEILVMFDPNETWDTDNEYVYCRYFHPRFHSM